MARTSVLFVQTQNDVYADSMIHFALMANLDRSEYDVSVLIGNDDNSASAAAANAISDLSVWPKRLLPSREGSRWSPMFLWNCCRAIADLVSTVLQMRARRVKIVHCAEKPRDVGYAYIIARCSGARLVTHLHVKPEDWLSWLSVAVIKRADRIIAVSQFVADKACEFGFPRDRISVVHNGINTGEYIRRQSAIGEAPASTITIACVGRLVWYKGQDDLLAAVSQLVARHNATNIRLIIAGSDHGSGFLQKLEERIIAYGLEGSVSFVGHIDNVRDLLQATDIFCLPSFEEPFGMVFLEAMECGLPIVALNSGGAPEIVRHGIDGLLSEPGDIGQLASNLLALCEDRQMRRAMGEAGRKRASTSFTLSKMVSEIEAQYQLLQ